MPTAPAGPWLEVALAKGLIRPDAIRPASVADLGVKSKGVSPLLIDLPPNCSEEVFQSKTIAVAEAAGWEHYHTRNSRRSPAGFPDLVLIRGSVLIVAELKVKRNKPTAAQEKWLALFAGVPGVRVRKWRPEVWAAIIAELTAPVEN